MLPHLLRSTLRENEKSAHRLWRVSVRKGDVPAESRFLVRFSEPSDHLLLFAELGVGGLDEAERASVRRLS